MLVDRSRHPAAVGASLPRPLTRLIRFRGSFLRSRRNRQPIGSSMNRQVLKIILFALPKVLNHTARRVPAFRDRLRQRDLVAWIGLQDGSIGRIIELRGGRFRSRPGKAADADVSMVFKDVATALKSLLPNRKQADLIHAAKNFKVVMTGPDELLVWFTQTLNMSETAGLHHGNAHARRQPPLHDLHQWRSPVRLRQGRPHRAGHSHRVRPHRPGYLGDRSPWPQIQPAAPRLGGATRPDREVPGLFGQAHPLPDEAGRFRSHRRAQSPEQGQVRLCAHRLGRGPGHRRQGDQPAEARPRARFHHLSHVVPPPVGQRWLLPQRAHAFRQSDRLHPGRRQPGQLGGLVLGCHAPLRQFDAHWRGRGLWRGSRTASRKPR